MLYETQKKSLTRGRPCSVAKGFIYAAFKQGTMIIRLKNSFFDDHCSLSESCICDILGIGDKQTTYVFIAGLYI